MIIGDLNLDWAEQDPDYLAEVKAFLVYGSPASLPNGAAPELGLKWRAIGEEEANDIGCETIAAGLGRCCSPLGAKGNTQPK